MTDILVSVFSGLGGALFGGVCTWRLTHRMERNRTRREALLAAGEALQNYRVDYANFYVEYLSPMAREAKGHWARKLEEQPDAIYLRMMTAVDKGRGRLRVVHGALLAYFPKQVIDPLCGEIMKVLVITAVNLQTDCRDVDQVCNVASDLIPDLLRNHA